MSRSESIASSREKYASARLLITTASFCVSSVLLAFNPAAGTSSVLKVLVLAVCGAVAALGVLAVYTKARRLKAWIFFKQLGRGVQTLVVCLVILLTRGRTELLQLIFTFQPVLIEEPTPFCNLLRITTAVVAIVDAKSDAQTAVSVFIAVLDAFVDIVRLTVSFRSAQPQKDNIKILPVLHPPHAKSFGTSGSPFQRNSAFGRMHEIRRIGSNPSRIRNQHSEEHPKSADLSSIHNSREDPTPQSRLTSRQRAAESTTRWSATSCG